MSSYRRTTEFEDRDYIPAPRRSEPDYDDFRTTTRTITREREPDRLPAFLRENVRHTEAGPMVLRQREVETRERHRDISPSPVRIREERYMRRARSISPDSLYDHEHEHERDHSHTRIIETERIRSPPVQRDLREVRFVDRSSRAPSTVDEHEHIRIIETERQRIPSPSPSPPPPPPVVRGPIIERDVITHYTDIDHGVINARRPEPLPQPTRPRVREETRETDIDISLGKHRTEVDIHRSSSRHRSRSRDHRARFHDDEIVVRRDELLRVDDRMGRRRARSEVGSRVPIDSEAEYITSKIDARGRMGEARGGATRNWTIVDVPPGTERVRMDGAGGASTDTTWSKYSGVRRTKFIPDNDNVAILPAPTTPGKSKRDRLSVSIHDREQEIDIERTRVRRGSRSPKPPPKPQTRGMWTEITKDLVTREALDRMGYAYEETRWFFYIMDYLPYDNILQLIEFSEQIRRARKQHLHEIEVDIDWQHRHHHHHQHQPLPARRRSHSRRRRSDWDHERLRELEVVIDEQRPAGGYYYAG